MYIEFVISYILIGILAILLGAVIVLQCIILKKLGRGVDQRRDSVSNTYSPNSAYQGSRGVSICRNCGTPMDLSHSVCPRCGAYK